jgi:hypothetical protein
MCLLQRDANVGIGPLVDFGIRWGSIRQRGELKPARQIWCRSAAPRINDLSGLPGKAAE